MSGVSFEEIPWRRNELEALRSFLISARDRCSFASPTGGETLSGRSCGPSLLFGRGYRARGRRSFGSSPGKLRYRSPPTTVPLHDFYNPRVGFVDTTSTPSDDAGTRGCKVSANICILRGQTGCGKATTVRRLCKEIGLKIIEYDPFDTEIVHYAGGSYEAVATTLLRFLDNVRRRPGLRMQGAAETSIVASTQSSSAPRSTKRLRLVMGAVPQPVNDKSSCDPNEPHLIFLRDLPRSLLSSSNSDSVKCIRSLLLDILEGSSCGGDVASYPLLVCVNNSESDRLMLRSLLPPNYENHPRCLRLHVSQITKKKMKTLLSKYLYSTGRFRAPFSDHLVEVIGDMSFGDIRFGMVNLHFYSTYSRDCGNTWTSNLASLQAHMLERNTANDVFNLLGKVLVNKRVPTALSGVPEAASDVISQTHSNSKSVWYSRFHGCFTLSLPVLRPNSPSPTPASSLFTDYSDVLEILPTLSEDLGVMKNSSIEFDELSQKADIEEALSNVACISGYGMVHQPCFHGSLLGSTPISVRMFGLTDAFNPSDPLSFSKWPAIERNLSATPMRYPRAAMLPRLTRPSMYYIPEELLDHGNVEGAFLVNSAYEHYVQYFESIEDCAVMTTNLCFADVFATRCRYTGGYSEDMTEQQQRAFYSICLRSVADSNFGSTGESVAPGYRHFGKSQWHSVLRYDMDHLKGLYDGHLRDLISVTGRHGTPGSVYTCKHRAFVEIVPFMYMLLSQDTSVEGSSSCTHLDTSINVSNIMTESMLERIDLLIDRSASSPSDACASLPSIGTGKSSYNVFDSVTPKFKELLFEIGKHY
ncbi:hypothetical protein X943_001627 [Babesia divergens]|uniref:Uncharacterized protein n=1 Tax=Babesia divergens TaxID=32595 RepID=A0AAD9LGZ9_BABDI|nr:hypothetical protein X943_001627 [Babesia divergens]